MGQAARVARSAVDRLGLERLETHFISHEVYRRDDLAERQIRLARAVSSKIIPQLLRLHAEVVPDAPPVEAVIETLAPSSSDISGLADIVLGNDLEAAMAYIIVLRDKGMSMDTLFVELLEPTARYLGHLWDEDEVDFIDVTLGVARLQKLLATFNNSHMLPGLDTRRNVLLAAGWTVQSEFDGEAAMIADLAKNEWFAVAGLTAGSEQLLGALKDTITLVRKKSCNPAIGIMVGGPMFTKNPALVHEVGADATAPNAPAAVLVAQKLFDMGVLNS